MTNTLQEDAERLATCIADIEFRYCKGEHLGNLGIWKRSDASEAQNTLVKEALQSAFNAGADAMRNSAVAIAQNNKDNNRRDNHIAFEIRNLPRPEYVGGDK